MLKQDQEATLADQLAADVRQAVAGIGKGLDTVASPTQLHAFVERMIGQIQVNADGNLVPVPAKTAMASDESEAIATSTVTGAAMSTGT